VPAFEDYALAACWGGEGHESGHELSVLLGAERKHCAIQDGMLRCLPSCVEHKVGSVFPSQLGSAINQITDLRPDAQVERFALALSSRVPMIVLSLKNNMA